MKVSPFRLALPALLLLAPALAAFGETAFLQRGPLAVRGIEFLPANVLPAFRAEYLAEERQVEVVFTREALVLPSSWPRTRCGSLALREVPEDRGLTLCWTGTLREGEEPVFVFFRFEGHAPGGSCGWIEAFLQRFRYLLSFAPSASEVPFPAVLEFLGK